MPNRCATPTAHLRNARGKALEAIAEIDEIIRMNADPGVMDLRTDWAVGELLCAIADLRMAHQKAHEAQAKVFPEVVEKRRRAA